MDSEWSTLGMDMNKLEEFLENNTVEADGARKNKRSNRTIKAIVPMHTLGYPVDIDRLQTIANKYKLPIIEDATESLGSTYKGKKTGNFGQLGCFSFNGNKIMTTGGGGMIVTNDEVLAKKAKHLTTTAKTDAIEYDHDQVGYNYRLVNVLAGIGLGQLELMDQFVDIKRKNLAYYAEAIKSIPGMDIHTEPEHVKSNYWMYSLVLEEGHKYSVRELVDIFADHKIQTRPIWKLMNSLPMFDKCEAYKIEQSNKIYQRTISIPCSTSISEEEMDRVINVLKNI